MGQSYGEGFPEAGQGASRSGVSILLERCDGIDPKAIAPILMQRLGMVRIDAVEACERGGGVLADNVDRAAAEAVVADLKALGEPCVIVPAAGVVPLPRREVAHAARLKEKEAFFVEETGQEAEEPWSKGVALAFCNVIIDETEMKLVPVPRLLQPINPLTMAPIRPGLKQEVLLETREPESVIDVIFANPPRAYRIYGKAFDYEILGDQKQESWEANILTLARWLLYAMPQARANFDAKALMQTGRVNLATYEGQYLRNVLCWLLNLSIATPPSK